MDTVTPTEPSAVPPVPVPDEVTELFGAQAERAWRKAYLQLHKDPDDHAYATTIPGGL